MKKIIIKWLFGADLPTYYELLTEYVKSVEAHSNTLDITNRLADICKENTKIIESYIKMIERLRSILTEK